MDNLIKKITAPNGGVFTGAGTNTYLVGKEDITIIDPGPNIEEHINKIIFEGAGKIKRILVTHTHTDHSPAALTISKKLDIPMFGRLVERESKWEDETFLPDTVLNHGDIVSNDEYTLEVIHTPGHASNHLCFFLKESNCLLTGDHIMDGSTVVIAPPDGNMTEYIESLELLKNYNIGYFAPGHGNYMHSPERTIESIIRHRLSRESKVLRCIDKNKNSNLDELLLLVYDDVPETLHPIAKMSLMAHIIKLEDDNKIINIENTYTSN